MSRNVLVTKNTVQECERKKYLFLLRVALRYVALQKLRFCTNFVFAQLRFCTIFIFASKTLFKPYRTKNYVLNQNKVEPKT